MRHETWQTKSPLNEHYDTKKIFNTIINYIATIMGKQSIDLGENGMQKQHIYYYWKKKLERLRLTHGIQKTKD
jgi:hypothetical protein